MDIKAFREQYPQYNSMSDTDLADSLHQKYYSDIPKDQFYVNFGVSPQPQQPREPGWGEAFAMGIDQPLENMAKTARLGGFDRTADTLSGAMTAPQNVESPSARFINPRPEDWQVFGYGIGSMPKAIVEQGGQLGGSILSRVAGAAVGGAAGGVVGPVTGAVGAGVGALAGPFLFEAVQIVGPVAYERAKNNGREKPNEDDINWALGTAAASGAFNAVGTQFLPGGKAAVQSAVKRYLMAGAGEGVTETGQAFIQQAGETANTDKGLTLNPREAIGEGLLGAGAGVASHGVTDVAGKAKETYTNLKDDVTTPLDEDAAKRVAARINLYEAQGYDVMDVDPTSDKGAKQILTGINMDLGNEIKQLHDKVKPLLSASQDSELQDIFDRAALNTAVRKGVNRLKSGMTDENITKVEELVGNTEEGFALVEKLKEAREVGRMYQKGVKGGLSRFTDTISPISTEQGMLSIPNAMRLGSTYMGGMATGGVLPIIQTGAFLAGRAVDKLTGNRSRVAKYARVNTDPNVLNPQVQVPQGLRSLTGEQEAARRQAEAQKAARDAARAQAAMLQVAEAERKKNVRETGLRLMRETIAKDEVPGGGFLRSIYDAHGLKPRQIVLGLNRLRTSGEIDASIADAFLFDPNSLMSGNVGNQIVDRLVRLADAGTISRDANWKPQAAQSQTAAPRQTAQGPTMTSATRQPPMDERRRIAYEQQARANQERVSQAIISIQADPRIPDAIKPRLLEAAALIGKTNNKQEAQKIADGVDKALSFDTPLKMIAQSYLQPLVDQIRHAIDPNGPKPQAMRRSEAKITKARTEALVQGVINAANAVDKLNNPRPEAPQVSTKQEASFDPEVGRQRALQGYDNEPSDVRLTAPTIKLADLVGEKIMLIPADLTKGGEWFAGIDQSRLDDPIKTKGGPSFPLLKTYADGSWAWANKGKGKGTQKVRKAQENGVRYAIITAMSPDAHQSNDTVSKAVFGTLEAYVRDGRISTENLSKLAENIQGLTYKTQVKDASGNKINKTVDFKDFPGFGDRQKLHDYLEALPFQSRAELIKELRKARSEQLIGGPLASRVINAMRDPEYEGYNWGDGSLVIELPQSAEGASKRFDAEGTETHESYAYGMKGRVVGKLSTPVNYKALFPDWISRFAKLPESQKQKVTGDNYPIQEITPELVQNLDGNVALQDIKSSRHADMLLDAVIGNWRDSATAKNADGLDVAEFTHQLKVSKFSTMLTQYADKKAFTDDVKKGLKVWQLGNSRVYVGIKPVNYAQEYGAKDVFFSEPRKSMVSVVNNEAGAKGMGAAAVLKAIEEGAEVLDCFALPTPKYPKGFLPSFYEDMGFEVVETIPFDPSYYSQQEVDGMKQQWKNMGWTEGTQMPTIALMRWRGTDEDRSEATRAYIGSAGQSLPGRGDGFVPTGPDDPRQDSVADGQGRRGTGERDAGNDRGGRGDLRRNVERGFHSAALEAAGLSPGLIRSLNLDPKKIIQAQQALASRGLSFGPKQSTGNQ